MDNVSFAALWPHHLRVFSGSLVFSVNTTMLHAAYIEKMASLQAPDWAPSGTPHQSQHCQCSVVIGLQEGREHACFCPGSGGAGLGPGAEEVRDPVR